MVRFITTAFLVGAFVLPSAAMADNNPPSGENGGGNHADHPTRPCRAEGAPSNNSGPYRADDCTVVVCPPGTTPQKMEQVKLHGRAARVHRYSHWFRVANDDDNGDDHGDKDNHGHGHKEKVVCVPNTPPPGPPAVVPPAVKPPVPVAAPAPAPVVTTVTAPVLTPAQKKQAAKRKAARKRATKRAQQRAQTAPQLTG